MRYHSHRVPSSTQRKSLHGVSLLRLPDANRRSLGLPLIPSVLPSL
nr:MAG TPA: hypothetical protein [Caudoviricetes sp.]